MNDMSIVGYYDGTAVRVKEPLPINQKVIVIPIENDTDLGNRLGRVSGRCASPICKYIFNQARKRCLEEGSGRKA